MKTKILNLVIFNQLINFLLTYIILNMLKNEPSTTPWFTHSCNCYSIIILKLTNYNDSIWTDYGQRWSDKHVAVSELQSRIHSGLIMVSLEQYVTYLIHVLIQCWCYWNSTKGVINIWYLFSLNHSFECILGKIHLLKMWHQCSMTSG